MFVVVNHFILLMARARVCPICMEVKENVNAVSPCMHLVCFDCLSVWTCEAGKTCPVCRAPFSTSFGLSKDGEVEACLLDQEPLQITIDLKAPTAVNMWGRELEKRWKQLPHDIWAFLQEMDVHDQMSVLIVMKILATQPTRAMAEAELGRVFGDGFPASRLLQRVTRT